MLSCRSVHCTGYNDSQCYRMYGVLLLCCALVHLAHTEVYTALVEMEELLETEAVLIRTLDGYIAAQEHKLRTLRR